MKIILKSLSVIMLIMAMAGCAAQKTGSRTGESTAEEVLYKQAIQALDERKFIIEATEFYFPGGKYPTKSETNSQISMDGNKAVIRFSPDLFPRSPMDHWNIEDDAAEITKGEHKKNGDIQFSMKIDGAQKWQDKELIIILYKNTNTCFVHVNGGYSGHNIVDFKGYVYPLATE